MVIYTAKKTQTIFWISGTRNILFLLFQESYIYICERGLMTECLLDDF